MTAGSGGDGGDSFVIVTVASGARSLRSLEHGETFHPVVGPMAEARGLHVAQQRLVERARGTQPFVVWDVGLGAAANAIAVLEALSVAETGAVELHSFDATLAPLEFAREHAAELGYFTGWENAVAALLRTGAAQCGAVSWRLQLADFHASVADARIPAPHAVIFDPYSPTANPGLWTRAIFAAIRARAADECLLTNYSRATPVRVALLGAGWFVGRGGATGEKDETTIAATRREMLAAPLDAGWLARVRRSTVAGPAVADELRAHPQFLTADEPPG